MGQEIDVGKVDAEAEKLRKHNEKIMKLIAETKEYKQIQRIKILYEELMKKTNDEHKKEIYSKQYLRANSIFAQRIGEYNKHWPDIKNEI